MLSDLLSVQNRYIHARYYDPRTGRNAQAFFHSATISEVRQKLSNEGFSIVSLDERAHRLINRQFYFAAERSNFIRTFAAFLKGGTDPNEALRKTCSLISHPVKRAELQRALDTLDAGEPLDEALRHVPHLDHTTRAFLTAGTSTNAVQKIIDPLLDFRARAVELWRNIGKRTFIVGGETLLALATSIYMEVDGFDTLISLMGEGSTPEFAAKAGVARFANMMLILLGLVPFLVAPALLLARASNNDTMRLAAGRFTDWFPGLSTLFRHLAIAETFSISAFMLRANGTFIEAATLAKRSTFCPPARHFWDDVLKRHIDYGQTVTESMASAGKVLSQWEQMPLRGHSGTTHADLASTMLTIAGDRLHEAELASASLVSKATTAFVLYLIATMGIFIYLLNAQSSTSPDIFGVL
jgi:type II secretory pathway component PulF